MQPDREGVRRVSNHSLASLPPPPPRARRSDRKPRFRRSWVGIGCALTGPIPPASRAGPKDLPSVWSGSVIVRKGFVRHTLLLNVHAVGLYEFGRLPPCMMQTFLMSALADPRLCRSLRRPRDAGEHKSVEPSPCLDTPRQESEAGAFRRCLSSLAATQCPLTITN